MTPDPRFHIEVTDARAAERARAHVKIGTRFVFTDGGQKNPGRLARLLGKSGGEGEKKVFAIADRAVELTGFRVVPDDDLAEPLHALTCDRDLYRAEEDTVNLFVAVPAPPADLKLVVDNAGDVFTERALSPAELPSLKEHGVHIEPLSMLLPGEYSAQLAVGERRIGQAVRFTVAEYTLAPLTGRLLTHSLDRGADRLSFSLAVESYEQPFDRALRVELLSGADVVDEIELEAMEPGRYEGAAQVSGEGALRLRLVGKDDAERTCEVVLPGSRKRERQATVVSELGDEKLLSLMPEPGALSLRGAWLSDGDFLGTPVVVDEIVTARGRLEVRGDVAALTTVTVDLATGANTVVEHGDRSAGDVVELAVPSAACTVFVGGWVNDRPFEGFTHLFRPARLELSVAAEHDAENKTLAVRVKASDGEKRPVLLCVRDERLTATDTPEVALSASMKRAVETETAGFGEGWQLLEAGGEAWTWMKHGLKPVDLDAVDADPDLLSRFSVMNAQSVSSTPVTKRDGRLLCATSRPELHNLEGMFQSLSDGAPVEIRWASEAAVARFIEANRSAYAMPPPGPPAPGAFPQGMPMRASMRSRSGGSWEADTDENMIGGAPLMSAEGAAPEALVLQESAAYGGDMDDLMDEDVDYEEAFDEPTGSAAMAPLPQAKGALWPAPATPAAHGLARGDEGRSALPAPPLADERATFPEVIFYGLVEVSGEETIELPLGDALGTFTLEAFALADGDWTRTRETVVVDQPVRVDLDVPPAVFEDDVVTASFRAAAASGQARVSLTRDGTPVELLAHDGAALPTDGALPSPVEARFRVAPGEYVATVEDAATGERDRVSVLVGTPGELRSYAREVGFLQTGDKLSLADAGDEVLSLRVLPGLKETTTCLVEATAGYTHLCCEQTAAKMLSATVMFLTAEDEKTKSEAEKILLAGAERQKKMFLPGRGFAMYPRGRSPNEYWGAQCVRHLWRLRQLQDVPDLSRALAKAVRSCVEMADDAGRGHGVERVPAEIRSAEDAYVVAMHEPTRAAEAAQWIAGVISFADDEPRAADPRGAAHNRAVLAYGGAVLLMAGDLARGVRVADVVLRQLNGEGRLYSTFDSVAAIALLVELERAGVGKGKAEVTANGKRMTAAEAMELGDQVETLEVHEGVVAVELSAIRTERWSDFKSGFPVRVGFRDAHDNKQRTFRQGDRAELVVELSDGYTAGDLVHVALPAALSWMKGGGRVRQFTVDFEGETEVRVPLLVTGAICGEQRFAVCVRNMFEEERASNPGLLTVRAA